MAFTLPPLPYAFDALEPYIDEQTMRLHHGKHHQTYVDKLNAALEKYPELQEKSVEDLLRSIDDVPEAIRATVRNHGGGHANHAVFWQNMRSHGGGEPTGDLARALAEAFGGIGTFRETLTQAAVTLFGSGWAWLVAEGQTLRVVARANQDSPVMDGFVPLLGLDVWEHAYYLKYQNRRADYVAAWWNVVNWEDVARRLSATRS